MKEIYRERMSVVFQGDAADPAMSKEVGQVDCIITSPPYNAGKAYDGVSDEMDWEDYWTMIMRVGENTLKSARPGAFAAWNIPMWMDSRPKFWAPDKFKNAFELVGWEFRDWISWVKGSSFESIEPGSQAWGSFAKTPAIRSAVEPIMIFRKPGGTPREICDMDWPTWSKLTLGVWLVSGERDQTSHPARFPYEIATRLVRLYSAPGETVFDPFAGSFTVPLAAKNLGRIGIGMDLSDNYCLIGAEKLRQQTLL